MLLLAVAAGAVLLLRLGPRSGGTPLAVISSSSSPRSIYVAPTGNDRHDGSMDAPLRTLSAAAGKAGPGDVVYIRRGTYDERVDFSRSGTEGSPITFQAYRGEGVTIARGFRVSGSYVVVRDVEVAPGETDRSVLDDEKLPAPGRPIASGQILVSGDHDTLERIGQHDEDRRTPAGIAALVLSGSHDTVRDIDFHDCGSVHFAGEGDGGAAGSGRYNVLHGGRLHHTRGLLIGIGADDSTVEDLDMHDPGQTEKGPLDGNAADGINLNARNVTIRRSRIYHIFKQVETQHCDAIQWWNAADDLVIEGNIIGSRAEGGDLGKRDHGHIQFESAIAGQSSKNVVIRNNVFLGTAGSYWINSDPGSILPGQADGWRIIGNTFYDQRGLRGDFLARMGSTRIEDNVFFAANRLTLGEGSVYDFNAYVGVAPSVGDGTNSFTVAEAGFRDADVSAKTNYGLDADLRPLADSRLVGGGAPVEGLERDRGGKPRPERPTPGAYEP